MLVKVVFALCGLLVGFFVGLGVLNVLLRDKSREDLRSNKELHRKYGVIGWLVAIIGAIVGIWLTKYV